MPKTLVNGINFHYQQLGEGPDIVMIHGITGNLAIWHLEIIPALESAQGATVEEFVVNTARLMVAAMQSQPDFLNLILVEIVEFNNVCAQKIFIETLPRVIGITEQLSSRKGNLRPIPTPMIIRTFIGLFFSYYLVESTFGKVANHEFRQDSTDYYVDVYLHGILDSDKPN